jgi:hypothetical protein
MNGDFDPLCHQFFDVPRNIFAGLDGALQVTADGVSRHGADFFNGFAVCADFR